MPQSSAQLPRLSVAMIVRDAADLLAATLASIRDAADEIVILDTGSEDDTPAIGRKFGAAVSSAVWSNDFSAARNECLAKTSGEWTLWLDAGETLSPEHAQQLKHFVQHQAVADHAYMLMIQVPAEGNAVEGEQIAAVRLAPRSERLRFCGRVRESMRPSLTASGIEVEGLPYRIQRPASEYTTERRQQIARRNIRLANLQIDDQGPSGAMLNCLGLASQRLGDLERSVENFKRALTASEEGSLDSLEAYYGVLTCLDATPGALDVQLQVCLKALETFPVDGQLLCAMGGYLQRQGRLDLATRSYKTAFQFGQIQPQLWHMASVHEIAGVCCSLALQLQGSDAEAEQILTEARQLFPTSPRLRRQMIHLHIKNGRREEAIDELISLGADPLAVRSAVRGACLAARKNWAPATDYLQVAYQAGCRDAVCLRWLAVSLLAQGKSAEVRPVLDEWRRVDPGDVELNQYLQLAAQAENATTAVRRVS